MLLTKSLISFRAEMWQIGIARLSVSDWTNFGKRKKVTPVNFGMKTYPKLIMVIIGFVIFWSCTEDKYEEGLDAGTKKGYAEGLSVGIQKGREEGYTQGFTDGIKRKSLYQQTEQLFRMEIPVQDIGKLVAKVTYVHYLSSPREPINAVLSKVFDSYWILDSDDSNRLVNFAADKVRSLGYTADSHTIKYFVVQEIYPIKGMDELLVLMRGTGFEFIPYVIAIFDVKEEVATLKYLLDKLYGASIGRLGIDKVVKYDEKSFVIQTNSYGGDAGEGWGAVSLSYWQRPYHVEEIFTKSFSSRSGENERQIALNLEEESLVAMVVVKERKVAGQKAGEYQYTEWVLHASDTVDVREFVAHLETQ